MADPVQRARDRERRELWIARPDRSIGNAVDDIIAEGAVDLPFGRVDHLAIMLGEVADIEADQALSIIRRHHLGITDNQLAQLCKACAAARSNLGDAVGDALIADRPALEQDLVLAAEIIVERRLGDVEPFGNIVERGSMITLLEE